MEKKKKKDRVTALEKKKKKVLQLWRTDKRFIRPGSEAGFGRFTVKGPVTPH